MLWNRAEGRVRAFWRLVLQYSLFEWGNVVLGSLVLFVPAVFGGWRFGEEPRPGSEGELWYLAADALASSAAALLSVWLAGRALDHRSAGGYGLRVTKGWWAEFGFGLVLGAVLIGGVFVAEAAFGWVVIEDVFVSPAGVPVAVAVAVPTVRFLCVGLYEELIYRGYQLTNLAEGLRFLPVGAKGALALAWVLSSSVFGAAHLANPNATVLSTVNVAVAGVMLGTGYVLTGRLGISVGLHVSWNLVQANVFGFPVSGIGPEGASLLVVRESGPELWTGGAFGPEGGLLGLSAMLAGGFLAALWVRKRYGSISFSPRIVGGHRESNTSVGS